MGDVNRSVVASQQPTITAGAYSAGDAVGGLLTFTGVGGPGGGGIIQSVIIIDEAAQEAELDLVLFDQSFTATSDNAAFDPSDAELANCLGVITVDDYASFNDNSVGTKSAVGHAFRLNSGTDNLYGQLVTRGTPTYAATDDLTIKLIILQD